jgi:dihydrofolate reductase
MSQSNLSAKRRVIYSMNTTLDGYYAGPNGELEWVLADDEFHDYFTNFLKSVESILFGRVMYQVLENFWPTAPADPSLTKSELDFARRINEMPKFVFSKTLDGVHWNNTTLVKGDSIDGVSAMKQEAGGDLSIGGGARILAALTEHQLIDEYRIQITPVVLGQGKPLFANLHTLQRLTLVSSETLGTGTIALTYRAD